MDQFPVVLIAVIIILIWVFNSLNVLREYERGVIFRIGRLMAEPKGPGLIWVIWPIDRIVRVSLRTITMDVPTQDVITKDNVSVKVNAVVYFRVVDPLRAIVEVENYLYATSQLKVNRSEEHTSELQSRLHLVCRLLLEKKKNIKTVDDKRATYALTRLLSLNH